MKNKNRKIPSYKEELNLRIYSDDNKSEYGDLIEDIESGLRGRVNCYAPFGHLEFTTNDHRQVLSHCSYYKLISRSKNSDVWFDNLYNEHNINIETEEILI